MDSWNEIKTAYYLAQLGTVTAAANALGVHRVTVIRHVDALEAALGQKLFHRHARGYEPTEIGRELMTVGRSTEDQFARLLGRARAQAQELTGDLVLTSVDAAAPIVTPALIAFRARHPSVIVRYLVSDRLFKLEYGEAHVAVRAGPKPQDPDNVVQSWIDLPIGFFASAAYLARRGRPETRADLAEHDFVAPDAEYGAAQPFQWTRSLVSEERFVLRVSALSATVDAIAAGAGVGLLPRPFAEARPNLVPVLPDACAWSAPLWLVTHVDLHRTAKVQEALQILKEAAPTRARTAAAAT